MKRLIWPTKHLHIWRAFHVLPGATPSQGYQTASKSEVGEISWGLHFKSLKVCEASTGFEQTIISQNQMIYVHKNGKVLGS